MSGCDSVNEATAIEQKPTPFAVYVHVSFIHLHVSLFTLKSQKLILQYLNTLSSLVCFIAENLETYVLSRSVGEMSWLLAKVGRVDDGFPAAD